MQDKINLLFKGICTLLFKFSDDSVIKTTSTLNKEILTFRGVAELDGIVDLETNKLIPNELFDHLDSIVEGTAVELHPLDAMFQQGGKVSW